MILRFAFFAFTLLPFFARSQDLQPSTVVREQGQRARVQTDSAMVFDKPSFDGAVIRYLRRGQGVAISRRRYGDFFKVKIDAGKFGYVAASDVKDSASLKIEATSAKREVKARNERARKEDAEEEASIRKSVYETRYIGGALAFLDFADGFNGAEFREAATFYGVKLTGPGFPFAPPSEFNLLAHFGSPSFYERFSSSKPSGFALLSDFLLMFPFAGGDDSQLYALAGPMLSYSSWDLAPGGQTQSIQEFSIGLSLAVGGAIRIGHFAARAEYKYMIQAHNQRGFGLSVQGAF